MLDLGFFLFIWHRFENFHWISFIRTAFIVIVHCYECDCKYDWCGSMLSVQNNERKKNTAIKSYIAHYSVTQNVKNQMVACERCSLHTMPIILCQLLYSRWPSIKWRRSIFSLSKYTLVSSYCVYAETKPISSPQLVHNDDVTPRHKSSHRREREKERDMWQ